MMRRPLADSSDGVDAADGVVRREGADDSGVDLGIAGDERAGLARRFAERARGPRLAELAPGRIVGALGAAEQGPRETGGAVRDRRVRSGGQALVEAAPRRAKEAGDGGAER